MNINNYASQVPSAVRGVFDSYIPFGSDFVYYCIDNSYGNASYRAVYRKIGGDQLYEVVAVRQSDGTYSFSSGVVQGSISSLTVSHPEYAYSNLTGVGQFYELSSGNTLLIVCVVVLASLMILKTVFGGIKWVRSKRYQL